MVFSDWLSPKLKQEIRNMFEPRYKRKLKVDEVIEIANNLTTFMENYLRFKQNKKKRV